MLALAVFVVAYPLFRPPTALSRPAGASADENLAELLARRDVTYVALKELELDHEMGRLSSSDYQALRDQYRAQAVAILQELDARQAEAQAQAAEERVFELKIEQEIEREIAARQRRRSALRCRNCGSVFQSEDRFCRRCGVALGLGEEPI
jgi:rRNA maturation endonuclease Nob1